MAGLRCRTESDSAESNRSSSFQDESAIAARVLYTPDAIAHKLANRRRSFNLEVGGDDSPLAELVVDEDDRRSRPVTPAGSPDRVLRTHRPSLSLVVSSPGSDRPGVRLGRARPLFISAPLVPA